MALRGANSEGKLHNLSAAGRELHNDSNIQSYRVEAGTGSEVPALDPVLIELFK